MFVSLEGRGYLVLVGRYRIGNVVILLKVNFYMWLGVF